MKREDRHSKIIPFSLILSPACGFKARVDLMQSCGTHYGWPIVLQFGQTVSASDLKCVELQTKSLRWGATGNDQHKIRMSSEGSSGGWDIWPFLKPLLKALPASWPICLPRSARLPGQWTHTCSLLEGDPSVLKVFKGFRWFMVVAQFLNISS